MIDNLELMLFDFGGVLYNIDHSRTLSALANLSRNPENIKNISLNKFTQEEILINFEKGLISPLTFREKIREMYNIEATDEELDRAWNLTLISPIDNAFNILSKIKSRYRIALLSNTNEIHCEKFSSQCKELLSLFEKVFYSFKMNCRKPEKRIFEEAIGILSLPPNKILFIDDSIENVETAKQFSLNTYHINSNNTLSKLVRLYLNF